MYEYFMRALFVKLERRSITRYWHPVVLLLSWMTPACGACTGLVGGVWWCGSDGRNRTGSVSCSHKLNPAKKTISYNYFLNNLRYYICCKLLFLPFGEVHLNIYVSR